MEENSIINRPKHERNYISESDSAVLPHLRQMKTGKRPMLVHNFPSAKEELDDRRSVKSVKSA